MREKTFFNAGDLTLGLGHVTGHGYRLSPMNSMVDCHVHKCSNNECNSNQ